MINESPLDEIVLYYTDILKCLPILLHTCLEHPQNWCSYTAAVRTVEVWSKTKSCQIWGRINYNQVEFLKKFYHIRSTVLISFELLRSFAKSSRPVLQYRVANRRLKYFRTNFCPTKAVVVMSAHRIRDDITPFESVYGDNGSVKCKASNHSWCFYYETKSVIQTRRR